MLVLSRKTTEKILIGDNITLTVLRVKGKTVRIGIDAPNSVDIKRGELCLDTETLKTETPKMETVSKSLDSLIANSSTERSPELQTDDADDNRAIATLKFRRDQAPTLSNSKGYPRLAAIVKKINEKVESNKIEVD